MQTFKPSDTDKAKLTDAAKLIKAGNSAQASGKKQTDAGKVSIAEWLKVERKLDVSSLVIGDMVQVEGICLVECGKQSRFDLASFQLKHPTLYAEFMRDFETLKYKPLV